jgi:hypothetical protein
MKVLTVVLVAAAVGLGSTAWADPYKDLAAQGYRWVIVDGPYASPSKEDLREITRHRTDLTELKMIQDLRVCYLIRGIIVQVVQEDAASGMSEIHVPGHPRTFWTLKRFLSRTPVRDTLGVVETPATSNMIPQEQMGVLPAGLLKATSAPAATTTAGAGAANPPDATPMPGPK